MSAHPNQNIESMGVALAAIAGLAVAEHEPMGRHLSMGVGGPARWFAVAENPEALARVIDLLRGSGVPWMMLGGGSNTIFDDRGYAGAVVALGRAFSEVKAGPGPHQVTAGAAAALGKLMKFAQRAALAGLEFTAGVPGTLGGALAGNAGTAAGEVCPLAESVEVLALADCGLRIDRDPSTSGPQHPAPNTQHPTPNPEPHSALRAPHSAIPDPHSALRTPHSALPDPHSAIPDPHSALSDPHSAIPDPHSALRNPHSAIPDPHSALRTPHSALRTPQSSSRSRAGNLPMAIARAA